MGLLIGLGLAYVVFVASLVLGWPRSQKRERREAAIRALPGVEPR